MMNAQQLSITALVAAVAGSIGAAVTTLASEKPATAPTTSLVPTGGTDASLLAQLDELRAENRDLVFRVTALEARSAERVDREPVASGPAAELAPTSEPPADAAAASPPGELQVVVEDALRSIRDQEERERDERRRQAELDRLERRLTEMTEQLGLAPYQTDEMRTILLVEDERRDEMIAQARESGDFMILRDSMRELRDATGAQVAEVLTAEQYEQYQEMGRGFGFGAFGGGGGGEGGGGWRGRAGRGDRGGGF